MDVAALTLSIVGRLNSKIVEYPARLFPADPGKARGIAAAFGENLVRYAGSTYGPARRKKNGALFQLRSPQIEITCRNRCLDPQGKNIGIYQQLEAAAAALNKWTPDLPGATFLTKVSDGFVDENEGIWEHAVILSFTFPEVTA